MAEKLLLKAYGLSTYADAASRRPEGSLAEATNVVIDKEGIFSPRRGFEQYASCAIAGPVTFDQPLNLFFYQDTLIAYANKSGTKNFYRYDSGNEVFVKYTGDFSKSRIRTAESNSNFYIASNTGVFKLDVITGSLLEAGMPQALGGSGTTTGSSGFMDNDSVVAYRVLWGYRDVNDNLIYGPPSDRIIVPNSAGGARDISLTFYVPDEITTSHFYQVYRTTVTATATSDPGDEMRLVYEDNYVSGTSITITDQTIDDLRGVDLYTNESQETTAQANYQPPQCDDIALFNGYMFFANVQYRQSYTTTLLATGTSARQLNVDDTFVIVRDGTTLTYTGKAAENASAQQFKVYTGGSPATDIRQTCESLVKCINVDTNNTVVYAYYESGYGDLPGTILIEERDFSQTTFTVQSAGAGDAFNPIITTAQSSTAEDVPHGLAFSKYQQPEAAPITNLFRIGNRADEIKRIVALRDSLFIFKADGIYRLTGNSATSFNVELFDSSTRPLAPHSICVLNNMVYGLFDQGVCQVSESGVSIISRDIEGTIKEWMGASFSNLEAYTFAVPYETDRKYLLWVPESSGDTYPSICYVYNTLTDSWTTYDIAATAAVVNQDDDKLYLAKGSTTYVSVERKDYALTDYADEQLSVTCTAITDSVLTLSSVANIEVDDIYFESDSKFSKITAVDTTNSQITVAVDLDFSSSDPIEFTVDKDTDLFTAASSYTTGTRVQVTSTDTLPPDLSVSTDYYVILVSSTTFRLATTEANALSNTYIDITNVGSGTHSFFGGYAEVRKQFTSVLEWNPITFNSPSHLKQFIEAAIITTKSFEDATVSFQTDIEPAWENIDLEGQSVGLWGLFDWGEVPWGGEVERIVSTRTYIPKRKARGNTLSVKFSTSTVFADWEVSGIEIAYRDCNHRSGR